MWQTIVLTVCLTMTGCAIFDDGEVPREFRHACGNPGAEVNVRDVPVTVGHKDCDLTGVKVTVRGGGGAVVPEPGMGVGSSSGVSVTRNAAGDVTVDIKGEAGGDVGG